jgi:trimethylamine--corrinoid protein Co-methyltransferase
MEKIIVKPRLSVLNSDQIEYILSNAIKLLNNPGIQVDSGEVTELFRKKIGASSILQNNRVCIPEKIIKWAIQTVPKNFNVYERNGNIKFQFGDHKVHCGIGVTSLYYQEPITDVLIPFGRKHMQDLARLASHLNNYHVISTIGIVQDVPIQLADLYATLELVSNTQKPLILLISDGNKFPIVLRLLEEIHGNLADKPFVIPYLNPITPLILNKDTTDKLQISIERDLPVIFSNYSLAGMTSPITQAGILSLLLAELLAGLVLSQLLKPGTSVVLGMLPAFFDMKALVNFYDPKSFLMNIACAEIMDYLEIPHCGTSGSGTGWGADLIAAGSYWMNYLSYFLSNGGLAPFVGDSLGSKTISPKTIVLVHEIIEQAHRFSSGFDLDDESSVLDEIVNSVGSGSFLSAPSTLKNFKNGYYTDPIFKNLSMEKWLASNKPSSEKALCDYTLRLLSESKEPDDYGVMMSKGEQFIKRMNFD